MRRTEPQLEVPLEVAARALNRVVVVGHLPEQELRTCVRAGDRGRVEAYDALLVDTQGGGT